MLNPIWLNTFVTLIDTGHFTQAADKLFMTQPGVSQHINKLEQACGHSLIKREKKSFAITEQGRLVYDYAVKMVRNEQALLEQLAFDDPFSGEVSLACSGSVALRLYPQLLKFQAQYPGLIVRVKAAPNHQILDEITLGKIDQGIVTDIPNKNLFDIRELGEEELCLIVPATSDIQRDKISQLMDIGLISHPDAKHYLSLYCDQCNEPAFAQIDISRIPVVGAINQISQILQPVAEGIGFTVLPRSALESFQHIKRLKVLKPQKPVIEKLYLVKKKNRLLPARFNTINRVINGVW